MKHEPFNFDSFSELLKRIYRLGFYKSVPEVMKVTVRNAFEGFSGRASETWETQFEVEVFEVVSDNGKVLISADKQKGRTMEEACSKILAHQTAPPKKESN